MRKFLYIFAIFFSKAIVLASGDDFAYCDSYQQWEESSICEESAKKCCGQEEWCFDFGVELGYRVFNQFPSFSYGFVAEIVPSRGLPGQTIESIDPFSVLSSEDTPKAPYGEAFIAIEVPDCFVPCWLLNGLAVKLKGSVWTFHDSFLTEYLSPVNLSTAFLIPLIDGSQVIEFLDPVDSIKGNLNRRYTYSDIDLIFNTCYGFCLCNCSFNLEPFLAFNYNKLNQLYGMSLTNIIPPIISMDFYENLYTNYYDFGGGAGVIIPFWRVFFVETFGGFFASYASTRLSAQQTLISGGGSEFIELKDQKHIWSFKFKGGGSINYCCADHVTVGIAGKYEYWSYAPELRNPQIDINGVALNPLQIRDTSISNYTVEARFAFSY